MFTWDNLAPYPLRSAKCTFEGDPLGSDPVGSNTWTRVNGWIGSKLVWIGKEAGKFMNSKENSNMLLLLFLELGPNTFRSKVVSHQSS